MAMASLCCGIAGLLVAGVVPGPPAIVSGVVGKRQAPARGGAGMARAGLVPGVIALVLAVVMIIVSAASGGFTRYVGG